MAMAGDGVARFAGGEDGRMRLWAWGPSSLEAIAISLFAFTCQVCTWTPTLTLACPSSSLRLPTWH